MREVDRCDSSYLGTSSLEHSAFTFCQFPGRMQLTLASRPALKIIRPDFLVEAGETSVNALAQPNGRKVTTHIVNPLYALNDRFSLVKRMRLES